MVYLLWGQYEDQSGQVFVAVYESQQAVVAAKEIAEAFNPSMEVKIESVPFIKECPQPLAQIGKI